MFEQFMKLPPAQKAGVLAAVLAVIGAAGYFLAIEPVVATTAQDTQKLKKIQTEVGQLRESAREEALLALRKKKDRLVERDKENRKMLPTSDEVPDFIESVQKDALKSGLHVTRFDRLPTQSQDLVNAIPVKMTVEGTMLDLITFLRVYAGSDRRVINLRDISIETVKQDLAKVLKEYKASRPLEDTSVEATLQKNDAERLLERIEVMELARKRSTIRATFTAFAFTWTGKDAEITPDMAQRMKIKKKRT